MSMEMDTEISPTDNAEIYRKATGSKEPLVNHKRLQFLDTYNDDGILLGAANLTGRYWDGSVWVFDNCSTFEKSSALARIHTESVVTDAAFVAADKLVLGEDNGAFQVFSIIKPEPSESPSNPAARCKFTTVQHDDCILSVSAFNDGFRCVTGGMDYCIKVWDIDQFVATNSYDGAHRDAVTCVGAKPKTNDLFASTSRDEEAVLWDTRKEHAANVIYEMPGRQLLALAWSPHDENLIVVGDSDGVATLLDIRKPLQFVDHSKLFEKSIHKLKYDPKRPNLLAACCDDTEIKVVDDSKAFKTVYHDRQRHSDFVRGIAWYDKQLITCSWDNTVLKHEIEPTTQQTAAE